MIDTSAVASFNFQFLPARISNDSFPTKNLPTSKILNHNKNYGNLNNNKSKFSNFPQHIITYGTTIIDIEPFKQKKTTTSSSNSSSKKQPVILAREKSEKKLLDRSKSSNINIKNGQEKSLIFDLDSLTQFSSSYIKKLKPDDDHKKLDKDAELLSEFDLLRSKLSQSRSNFDPQQQKKFSLNQNKNNSNAALGAIILKREEFGASQSIMSFGSLSILQSITDIDDTSSTLSYKKTSESSQIKLNKTIQDNNGDGLAFPDLKKYSKKITRSKLSSYSIDSSLQMSKSTASTSSEQQQHQLQRALIAPSSTSKQSESGGVFSRLSSHLMNDKTIKLMLRKSSKSRMNNIYNSNTRAISIMNLSNMSINNDDDQTTSLVNLINPYQSSHLILNNNTKNNTQNNKNEGVKVINNSNFKKRNQKSCKKVIKKDELIASTQILNIINDIPSTLNEMSNVGKVTNVERLIAERLTGYYSANFNKM
jgi:hypothetical protein